MNISYGIAAAVMHTNSMGSSSRLDMNQLKQLAITHRMEEEEAARTATQARAGRTAGSIRAMGSTIKDPHPRPVWTDRAATRQLLGGKPGMDRRRAATRIIQIKVGQLTKDRCSKNGPE